MLWLSENIGWIKDILSIIFTGAATIIAVLTYRYAKVTIFQPEITKVQTSLLMDLLQKIPTSQVGFMVAADFEGTIRVNLARLALEFGFIVSNFNPAEEIKRSAALSIDSSLTLEDLGATADDMFMPVNSVNGPAIQNTRATKDGKIVVVGYTLQSMQFREMIAAYCRNPFMPKKVQEILLKIGENADYNNGTIMNEVLNNLLKEILEKEPSTIRVSSIGVHNEFAKRCVHIDVQLVRLSEVVREYLRVDDIEKRLH